MLNARASHSLPLVLLVIPAVVVVLYVVLSGLHWAVLSASPARFVMIVLLVVSAWLPVVYVFSRRPTTLGREADEEAKLARERTMLRTLIDNLPDFIYVKDRESRYLLVNLAAARLLGVEDPEQVLGKSYYDLHSHEQALRTFSHDQEVMCSGNAEINVQSSIVDPAGNQIDLLTTKTPLRDSDGRIIGVVGIDRDITAQLKGEAEVLRARDESEAANRAKSQFLANMSHEIRTPMNGVIGMTELLLDTELDALQRDYAETIRDSGTSLLTVINDILDFSKIEAGKLELEQLDVDLRDTFEDVARLLSIQAHAKGLEVTAQIDAKLPHLVKGDAGRIRQILLNLASNAIKFTSKGEVSLEIKVLETSELGTRVRCEVRDTGIGIPADRLDSLFAPFMQVDSSTTRKFGGTGLGLSIVRRLVELMGGDTGVESVQGAGSVFWFTAHFGSVIESLQPHYLAPASINGQRVLVVDDNATNRKVLMGQLLLCGVEPMSASSADQALALLRQARAAGRPFDAALLDHQMPDCDGAELGRIVIQDETLKSTRLILLTSSGQRGEGHLFADIGFAGYLLKPVAQRDLTECLMLVLANEADTWRMRKQPIITRHALRAQRARSRNRILLAEDNLVNQKVAVRLLEKLDYRVHIVADGHAVVAAWQSGNFDLILMDCQMPEMDGYEATRTIRRLEDGKNHIPIVALTAHAMKGDEEKCRAAGMDDYLPKPIDRAKLEACLDRLLPGTGTTGSMRAIKDTSIGTDTAMVSVEESGDSSSDPGQPHCPVDWPALLESIDGDAGFARELVEAFIGTGERELAAIAVALGTGDAAAMYASAHSLKGASSNLRASAATSAAALLEVAAGSGESAQIAGLAEKLRAEVKRTIEFLQSKVA
jgi:PAS domain S-box-containing protein